MQSPEYTSGNIEYNISSRSKIGAMIENPAAYNWLTGYNNLKIISRMYPNISNDEMDRIIKIVGLQKEIYRPYKQYSLGMKQRLGIAYTLLNNPEVIILDEPTNGLDFNGVCELRQLVSF